jgi:DNA-binding LacI/PurR family transcriptional regulator
MDLSRIVELADRLQQNIDASGLRPGDAYPHTEEIARSLGVSTSAANGALRVLAKRGILDRRPRRGSVVARRPGDGPQPALRRVHLLVHREYLQMEGLLADGLLIGIQGELPGAEMQFNFIPLIEGAEYGDQLVADALRSRDAEGFVLVRAPLAIQRAVHTSGLPAVVFGHLQPSVEAMPWIDRDHRQIGALAAAHLLGCRCRRVVALFRVEMGPGDFLLLDCLQQSLAAAGLGLGDFSIRCLSADREAARSCVMSILQENKRTTGFLCRSQLLAEGAAAAAELLGRRVPIVVSDVYRKPSEPEPVHPYARSLLSSEEIGHRIGRMLAQQARGEEVCPQYEMIAVALEVPGAARSPASRR